MSYPGVAIIILNWNGLNDTIECLASLRKISYPSYEVILVDNGSVGNDVEVLKEKFGDYIHMIKNERNYGFAEGCNIGMRYAMENQSPDYILLLNNDTVVDTNFLTELVKAAETNNRIGIAGSKTYFFSEPNRLQTAGARIRWYSGETALIGWGEIDKGQFDEIRQVEWVIGCSLLIKREVVEDIGLLYPAYFAYFEEAEWCVKCRKAGYSVVFVPGSKVWHKGKITAGRINRIHLYFMTRNQFLFMKRNASRLQFGSFFVQFFLLRVPSTTVLIMRQGDLESLRVFYKATLHGLALLLRHSNEESRRGSYDNMLKH